MLLEVHYKEILERLERLLRLEGIVRSQHPVFLVELGVVRAQDPFVVRPYVLSTDISLVLITDVMEVICSFLKAFSLL